MPGPVFFFFLSCKSIMSAILWNCKWLLYTHSLCIHFCGQGTLTFFITSLGPGVFCKEASGEGDRRGAQQLSVGGAPLLLLLNLVLLLVPAPFQKNLSWGEERRCQLFPKPPSLFFSFFFFFFYFFYFFFVPPRSPLVLTLDWEALSRSVSARKQE